MPTKRSTKKENAAQSWPQPNPALKDLAVLAGQWQMVLSNSAFLPSPADTMKGYVSVEWVEDGAFLEMRQGDKLPGPPAAVWLIGRDASSGACEVLYYDSRGVSRIYQMSFHGRLWKMWRDWPEFSQRYEATISEDGNMIRAHWEKREDGKPWEHDFDMRHTRTK